MFDRVSDPYVIHSYKLHAYAQVLRKLPTSVPADVIMQMKDEDLERLWANDYSDARYYRVLAEIVTRIQALAAGSVVAGRGHVGRGAAVRHADKRPRRRSKIYPRPHGHHEDE